MDKEYIEREAAINACYDGFADCRDDCATNIKAIPAADVVSVTRCSECKHATHIGVEYKCEKHSGNEERLGEDAQYSEFHSGAWFCADGERKDGDGE